MLMMMMDANQGRKYKSRKERPCDACRRRKVCCIREPGDEACSLCRMQSTGCRYDEGPTPRRRRTVMTLSDSNETVSSSSPPTAPSNSIPADSSPGEWISQYVGLSGDQDPFVLRHCNFNRSNYYKNDEWACLRVRSNGPFPSLFTLVPDSHLDARPSHYPSSNLLDSAYPRHHDLLATYFEVIHSSYPLLDPVRFTKGNKIDLPLLATMYSLATPFCSSATEVRIDTVNSFVFQSLPIEARSPRLETIEAALLSLQRHTIVHRAPTTPGLYAEVGATVGMCHDAGLHVDPTKWDLSASDKSRRKRLWWGVYIADKWAALGLGRPSYIHDDDCNVPLPTQEDIAPRTVSGDTLPQTSSRVFIAMAALSKLLSTLLSAFYTLKAAKYASQVPVDELISWQDYFEDQLSVFHKDHLAPLSPLNDSFLDPTGTLHLAYHTLHLTLYRAILRHNTNNRPGLRQKARSTLASLTHLLQNLHVTRLRAFWWSPISRINFAIAGGFMFSMLLSSISDADIEYWAAEIARFRRLLDLQSLAFDTTKLAAARMSVLANVRHSSSSSSGGRVDGERVVVGGVDPKQAFVRDFGVELNTL